jgi:hypothetical protein
MAQTLLVKHDFTRHGPVMLYNRKGQVRTCYSETEYTQARADGYVSTECPYVAWPKMFYHKQTGESRVVGSVDWEDSKNEAEARKLGPDWTTEVVTPPEPKARDSSEADGAAFGMIPSLMAELDNLKKHNEEMDQAVSELAAARLSLEQRVGELEQLIEAATTEPAKDAKDKAKKS